MSSTQNSFLWLLATLVPRFDNHFIIKLGNKERRLQMLSSSGVRYSPDLFSDSGDMSQGPNEDAALIAMFDVPGSDSSQDVIDQIIKQARPGVSPSTVLYTMRQAIVRADPYFCGSIESVEMHPCIEHTPAYASACSRTSPRAVNPGKMLDMANTESSLRLPYATHTIWMQRLLLELFPVRYMIGFKLLIGEGHNTALSVCMHHSKGTNTGPENVVLMESFLDEVENVCDLYKDDDTQLISMGEEICTSEGFVFPRDNPLYPIRLQDMFNIPEIADSMVICQSQQKLYVQNYGNTVIHWKEMADQIAERANQLAPESPDLLLTSILNSAHSFGGE